ncbi:hypothetical protein TcYC6_0118250 [Trypanosoma cruzi]|nr:hypothetical protein TcYC6_0118250 [Trypanosoma cruzi]
MVSNRPAPHGANSGRKQPLRGLSDECCSKSVKRVSNCRWKVAEVHRVNAGADRWIHAEGGGFQTVAASSDMRSHGKMWRTTKTMPPARPLQACWRSLQPMNLVAGALSCLHSCIRTMPGRCCYSRAATTILKVEWPEVLSCPTATRPSSSGLRLLRAPPRRVMPTE